MIGATRWTPLVEQIQEETDAGAVVLVLWGADGADGIETTVRIPEGSDMKDVVKDLRAVADRIEKELPHMNNPGHA